MKCSKTSIYFMLLFVSEKIIGHVIPFDNKGHEKPLLYSAKISSQISLICNQYLAPFNNGVRIVLPTGKESEIISTTFESLVQNFAKTWPVSTEDSFCCDTIKQWEFPGTGRKKNEKYLDAYIIPIVPQRKLVHFENQMEYLDRELSFNNHATFILLHLRADCEQVSSEEVITILNYMWFRNLFAVVLITYTACEEHISIFTARPFSSQNNCKSVENFSVEHSNFTQTAEKLDTLRFLHELPRTYNNCLFKLGTVPSPPYVLQVEETEDIKSPIQYNQGIDLEIMKVVSSELNMTYRFVETISQGPAAWFVQLPNRTILGLLQEAIEYKVDIIFGGIVPSYITYNKYAFTPSYKFSAICWYVPGGNVVPSWQVLYIVYPLKVWIASGLVFLLVSLLYLLMASCDSSVLYKTNRFLVKYSGRLLLNIFSIGLGVGGMTSPKLTYLRVLFVSWLIYTMNWNIVYQTGLFTLLTHPPRAKDLNSLKELQESEMKVATMGLYIDFFRFFESDGITKSILDNVILCDQIETCVKELAHHRNFSIMEKIESMEYLINLKYSRVHKIEENVLSYSVSFLLSRGNPLTKGISKIILRSFQAGFIFKWEYDVGWYNHAVKNKDLQAEDETMPLTLEDIVGAFCLLAFGQVIAFLCFISEIFYTKYCRHVKK